MIYFLLKNKLLELLQKKELFRRLLNVDLTMMHSDPATGGPLQDIAATLLLPVFPPRSPPPAKASSLFS